MQVKIYTKDLVPLTTLLQSDIEGLEYTDTIKGDGTATIIVRADSSKVSANSLRAYNRVRIYEGSTSVFYGFIIENSYTLNTITIRLYSIGYLLKNRTLGDTYVASGNIVSVIADMLTTVNSADPTGISAGTIQALPTVYSKTYSGGSDFDFIANDLLREVGQFRVDSNGLIQIAERLGADRTTSFVLRYDIRQIENSNIAEFKVKESAQNILTQIIAKRTGSTVTVTDTALRTKYGLVQATKAYNASTDPLLNTAAQEDLRDVIYAPEIVLSPKVEDGFNVCDILGIRLYNGIIDVATAYQVLEKTVRYIGTEKSITIKLNQKQDDLVDILLDQKKRLKTLENT